MKTFKELSEKIDAFSFSNSCSDYKNNDVLGFYNGNEETFYLENVHHRISK